MECKNERCGNHDLGQFMAYEDPNVYDGVLVWQCLSCGFAWARWEAPAYGRRHFVGVEWAERLNRERVS